MFQYIVYCIGIFFVVLEVIVLLFMLQNAIYLGKVIRNISLMLISPILFPMQKLVRRSIMNTFSLDLSPYILLIIIFFLERVCNYLLTI